MMSIISRFPHGHYDEEGRWRRTKFCFLPCSPDQCDCKPPNGVWFKSPLQEDHVEAPVAPTSGTSRDEFFEV